MALQKLSNEPLFQKKMSAREWAVAAA